MGTTFIGYNAPPVPDTDPYFTGTHMLFSYDTDVDNDGHYTLAANTITSSGAVYTPQGKYGGAAYIGEGGWIRSNTGPNLKTNAFTVEGWFRWDESNPAGVSGFRSLITNSWTTTWKTSGFNLYLDVPSRAVVFRTANGNAAEGTGNWDLEMVALAPIIPFEWFHIAVTRDRQGNWRMFKNGAQVATNTNQSLSVSNGTWYVGAGRASDPFNGVLQSWKGMVDDIRITKGVARYSSAGFDPVQCPKSGPKDPNWDKVVLLVPGCNYNELGGQSDGFRDWSKYGVTGSTATNWESRNDDPIIGNTSMGIVGAFPASGARRFGSAPQYAISGSDFTIECWGLVMSASATWLSHHGDNAADGKPNSGWSFGFDKARARPFFGWRYGGAWNVLEPSSAVDPSGIWTHWAVQVAQGKITLLLDGQRCAESSFAGIDNAVGGMGLTVGEGWNTGAGSNTYKLMNYARLTIGAARYTHGDTIHPIPFPLGA